ncbi:MAG TPA: thioredoxin family protein [Thermoanaerobaculia bacterium]|jgi:thiol-disulfide isomerase/thioredoxin
MTHKRPAVLAALVLALLAMPSAPRAQGVPSDGVLHGFQPTGEYTLMVNGKPIPGAEIYQNGLPAILVIATSALPSPVLLTPRAGSVETVHIMKIAKQPDGTVDLLADAVLAPVGQFQMQGENVTFTYEGRKVSLNPKPPLLGLRRGADLKAHDPGYARTATGYKPNGAAIASLKKEPYPATVRVVFGSWCPHCRQHVPYMLRVEEELKGSKIKFEYFGLPKPPDAWKNPEVKRLGVKGVPTGIVYVNGREVGRIEGQGWNAPEVLLNKIVYGPAVKGK